jgi:putative flippase GtrA
MAPGKNALWGSVAGRRPLVGSLPLVSPLVRRLRGAVGIRFTRFAGVALASLATSELTLGLCDGVFHLTALPAGVSSWFAGAVVSYLLSRWAWERKGKPDVLRETVPFWVISALVVVILTLSTKLGYVFARWMGLHGPAHVAFVGLVYLAANAVTFLARFVIFHYVLFAGPRAGAGGEPGGDEVSAEDVIGANGVARAYGDGADGGLAAGSSVGGRGYRDSRP